MINKSKRLGKINGVNQIKGSNHFLFLELKDFIKIEIK